MPNQEPISTVEPRKPRRTRNQDIFKTASKFDSIQFALKQSKATIDEDHRNTRR